MASAGTWIRHPVLMLIGELNEARDPACSSSEKLSISTHGFSKFARHRNSNLACTSPRCLAPPGSAQLAVKCQRRSSEASYSTHPSCLHPWPWLTQWLQATKGSRFKRCPRLDPQEAMQPRSLLNSVRLPVKRRWRSSIQSSCLTQWLTQLPSAHKPRLVPLVRLFIVYPGPFSNQRLSPLTALRTLSASSVSIAFRQ